MENLEKNARRAQLSCVLVCRPPIADDPAAIASLSRPQRMVCNSFSPRRKAHALPHWGKQSLARLEHRAPSSTISFYLHTTRVPSSQRCSSLQSRDLMIQIGELFLLLSVLRILSQRKNHCKLCSVSSLQATTNNCKGHDRRKNNPGA